MDTLVAPVKKPKIRERLFIYIKSDWSTDSFKLMLNSIEDIAYVVEAERFYSFEIERNKLIEQFNYLEQIESSGKTENQISLFTRSMIGINSIKYNSPGWIELLFSVPITLLVIKLILNYIPNKKQRLEQEKLKEEIKQLKQEVLKQEFENLKILSESHPVLKERINHRIKLVTKGLSFLETFSSAGMIDEFRLKKKSDDKNPLF